MATSQADEWRSRVGEPGWPFGGRPKPERFWSLWQTGSLMECGGNAHPLGYELRVYMGGDDLHQFLRS